MAAHFVGLAHLDALAAFASTHLYSVSVWLGDVSGDPGVALAPGVSADVLDWWQELEPDGRVSLGGRRAEVFDVLRAENFRSLRARYGAGRDGRAGDMWKESDETAAVAVPAIQVPMLSIVTACHGYEYQACEAPEYRESLAAGIVRAVQMAAIRRLPGYDDGPRTLRDADVYGTTPRGAVRALLEELEADRRRKGRTTARATARAGR